MYIRSPYVQNRKNFPRTIHINERNAQVIRTDKGTAITENAMIPRTERNSYLNSLTDIRSAKPKTSQVYSFASGDGYYDQLDMKAPLKLKCHVGNKIPYKI